MYWSWEQRGRFVWIQFELTVFYITEALVMSIKCIPRYMWDNTRPSAERRWPSIGLWNFSFTKISIKETHSARQMSSPPRLSLFQSRRHEETHLSDVRDSNYTFKEEKNPSTNKSSQINDTEKQTKNTRTNFINRSDARRRPSAKISIRFFKLNQSLQFHSPITRIIVTLTTSNEVFKSLSLLRSCTRTYY